MTFQTSPEGSTGGNDDKGLASPGMAIGSRKAAASPGMAIGAGNDDARSSPSPESPVPARELRPATPQMASGDDYLKNWIGAKGGAGVFQTIINNMPPHSQYIEAFVGSGQVLMRKKPATSTIVIDADAAVCSCWYGRPGITVIHGDAVPWLERYALGEHPQTVLYCDPPYLMETRTCQRGYYEHEFATKEEHERLLTVLNRMTIPVLISGYRAPLYDAMLQGEKWRRIDYTVMTHRGERVESLWCNFPEPFALHDYRYLGRDYRERERIKRKKNRWLSKLRAMPTVERASIVAAVLDNCGGAISGQG